MEITFNHSKEIFGIQNPSVSPRYSQKPPCSHDDDDGGGVFVGRVLVDPQHVGDG